METHLIIRFSIKMFECFKHFTDFCIKQNIASKPMTIALVKGGQKK